MKKIVLITILSLFSLSEVLFSSCSKFPTLPSHATPTPVVSSSTPTFTPTPVTCVNGGVVSTFAGTYGIEGSTNGPGTSASFEGPFGIAVDRLGNLYIGDSGSNLIRKITPGGIVSTLAGSAGVKGFTNGTGTSATFNQPMGVAVDASGYVYVADTYNYAIRKITPAGVVSTLAGSGTNATVDGTGTGASFSGLEAIAVDSVGNVYVSNGCMIRKITSVGVVSTFAGSSTGGSADGVGTAASFQGPQGLTVDASGNVYVGDMFNNKIRKITPGGLVTTLAGSGAYGSADGMGSAATFNWPQGVSVDECGNVFVSDVDNVLIRKITPGGVVTTLAGSGVSTYADGTGTTASFKCLTGLVVDSSDAVYVCEPISCLIRKIR
jgi:sugar lactone lactonase YvrE